MGDKILVAYATQAGSTRGVAESLAEQFRAAGHTVDLLPVAEVRDVSAYRAAVVGSAIHGGQWLPEALELVRAQQAALRRMPTAIFLVSLTQAGAMKHPDIATWLEPARSLLKPVAEATFTGAVLFKDYPRLKDKLGMRVFLAAIRLREGDYRDWEAIRAWGESTLPLLAR